MWLYNSQPFSIGVREFAVVVRRVDSGAQGGFIKKRVAVCIVIVFNSRVHRTRVRFFSFSSKLPENLAENLTLQFFIFFVL